MNGIQSRLLIDFANILKKATRIILKKNKISQILSKMETFFANFFEKKFHKDFSDCIYVSEVAAQSCNTKHLRHGMGGVKLE